MGQMKKDEIRAKEGTVTRGRRHRRKKKNPEEGVEKVLLVRFAAAVALGGLCVVAVFELLALRGSLAYMRFDLAKRAAEKAETAHYFASRVSLASSDADVLLAYGQGMPLGLWEASRTCLRWAGDERLPDPIRKLRLAEKAAGLAGRAVQAAPSDYLMWRQLARAQLALGLRGQARRSLSRAQQLAPPGKKLKVGSLQISADDGG